MRLKFVAQPADDPAPPRITSRLHSRPQPAPRGQIDDNPAGGKAEARA